MIRNWGEPERATHSRESQRNSIFVRTYIQQSHGLSIVNYAILGPINVGSIVSQQSESCKLLFLLSKQMTKLNPHRELYKL